MKARPISRTRIYEMWRAMNRRCYDRGFKDYSIYGGRGIGVCGEWRASIHNFVRDMGYPPEGKTLDRIDSNKSYSKDNCRWASRAEQTYNRRRGNKFITFKGETLPISAWGRKIGLKSTYAIRWRLKAGWPLEKALTTPKRGTNVS